LINNKKILGLLGLSARARNITFGADSTEQEIEKSNIKLVVIAEDASDRTKKNFIEKCNKYNIPVFFYGSIEEISQAIGKPNKAIIGVKNINMAREIEKIIRGDRIE